MRDPTREEMVEGLALGFERFLRGLPDHSAMAPCCLAPLFQEAVFCAAKEVLRDASKK